ncbi:MAG: hypothetical protein ACJ8G5_18265 [Burkholderiales bacterium]
MVLVAKPRVFGCCAAKVSQFVDTRVHAPQLGREALAAEAGILRW